MPLAKETDLLEHGTGATGATGTGEVVPRTAAPSLLPHAPGACMTEVTQTPPNRVTH